MEILILIPVSEEYPLEHATQHMEKVIQDLQSIFSATGEKLQIFKWFSLEKNGNLSDLTAALVLLRLATLVYFGKGWENFKDLQTIHYICEHYGIQRMEE